MQMHDDERAILRQALYNVGEGRERQEREHRAWLARQDPTAEDALLKWRRLRAQSMEPPKPAPPKPKQRENEMTERQVRAHVERRLEAVVALVGGEVGE